MIVMGSKRTKKGKPENEIGTKDALKNGNQELLNENVSEDPEVSLPNGAVPAVKASKRKKRIDADSEAEPNKKVKKLNSEVKVKKKSIKEEINIEVSVNGVTEEMLTDGNDDVNSEKQKIVITWPDSDIIQLIDRMENNIPEKDVLAYRSRIEKLNWNEVAFQNYTPDDCKKTWLLVQKKIRRFRLLKEILNDAKDWISTPKSPKGTMSNKTTNNKLPRPKRHPDMPRRPLSSYLLFYLNKKNEIISEHSGIEKSEITKKVGQIYKNLPQDEKEKYDNMAAINREEYMQKLKIFFENHPEYIKPRRIVNHKNNKEKQVKVEKQLKVEKVEPLSEKVKKNISKIEKKKKVDKVKSNGEKRRGRAKANTADAPPKKIQTPFGIYFASELCNMVAGTERQAYRAKCKEVYRQMSDEQKVHWINLAEQDVIRYQEEVKAYKLRFPNFKTLKITSVLTKRERASKERAAGKPVKPPSSAYALYSKVMLQSAEIKPILPRDRMNYISTKWKGCSPEEQEKYKDEVTRTMENYRQQFKTYVESLPEEEKRKMKRSTVLRKSKIRRVAGRGRSRKRKPVKKSPQPKQKFVEPEQPPISACKYFVSIYQGETDPIQAWKSLNADEKRKYEDELVEKKQAYILEFERFLKSLSKEELEAFSKSRQQQMQSDDDDDADSSACSSEDDDVDDDDVDDDNNDGSSEDNEKNDSDSD